MGAGNFFDLRASQKNRASLSNERGISPKVHEVTSVGASYYMASIINLSPSAVATKRTCVGLPCTLAGSGFSLVR